MQVMQPTGPASVLQNQVVVFSRNYLPGINLRLDSGAHSAPLSR
ncbi:MAG: hypothetical protein VKK04_25085 [Synechococcales bacterium]|nr:hypothetical protein [Synechococcales bacterium]